MPDNPRPDPRPNAPYLTQDQVRVVAVGSHRIDAQIAASVRPAAWLAGYAVRDQFGWAVIRRTVTGRYRQVARVDSLPEWAARRTVAGQLLILATS